MLKPLQRIIIIVQTFLWIRKLIFKKNDTLWKDAYLNEKNNSEKLNILIFKI